MARSKKTDHTKCCEDEKQPSHMMKIFPRVDFKLPADVTEPLALGSDVYYLTVI